jgi:hypothetical protein
MKLFWMLSILIIIVVEISSAGCTSLITQSTSANQTIDGITIPTTTGSPTPSEVRQIAAAAYVYGYPLVLGVPYSGENNYLLHFARNSTPPVNGFWSVTLYDSEGHFVPNPLNQFAITSHSGNLRYNIDGSLDIYIQNASPGADKESNWLPAPSGGFMLFAPVLAAGIRTERLLGTASRSNSWSRHHNDQCDV